jgi:uncharacterized protein
MVAPGSIHSTSWRRCAPRPGSDIYLDTSFVVPYYIEQTFSVGVEVVLREAAAGSLLVSSWTCVEFVSVLGRLARMEALRDPNPLREAFEEDARGVYVVVEPVAADFRVAADLLVVDVELGLRGPDALHLAIASSHETPLVTLDRSLLNAARALGIAATDAGVLRPGPP